MSEKVIICPERFIDLVEKACLNDVLNKKINKLEIRCEILDELIELIEESERTANGELVYIRAERLAEILTEAADNV